MAYNTQIGKRPPGHGQNWFELSAMVKTIVIAPRDVSVLSESSLKIRARQCADYCCRIRASQDESAFSRMRDVAHAQSIEPPVPKFGVRSTRSCVNRLCNDRWWLPALRKHFVRAAEAVARDRGAVRCKVRRYHKQLLALQ